MSTKTESSLLVRAISGFLGGAFAIVTLVLVLHAYGPASMAKGAAAGGAAMMLVFFVALWRAARRPQRASSFERTFAGTPDERDQRVATESAAVVGVAAIPTVSIAAVAVAIGAPTMPTFAILMYFLIALATVSFIITARRN